MLGTAALGDIGALFPDTDPAYAGADSRVLLRGGRAFERLVAKYQRNTDMTIVAQAPKMRPYIDPMRSNVAQDLKCDLSLVNVKATTTEGLGFAGRPVSQRTYRGAVERRGYVSVVSTDVFPRRLASRFGAAKTVSSIRVTNQTFVEELSVYRQGGGFLHGYIWKMGDNTVWIAQTVAKLAGKVEQVSYSGLKDRRADTRQWFSVNLVNRQCLIGVSCHISRPLCVTRSGRSCGAVFIEPIDSNYSETFEEILLTFNLVRHDSETRRAELFGEQRFGRHGSTVSHRGSLGPQRFGSRIYIGVAWQYPRFAVICLPLRLPAGQGGTWDKVLVGDKCQPWVASWAAGRGGRPLNEELRELSSSGRRCCAVWTRLVDARLRYGRRADQPGYFGFSLNGRALTLHGYALDAVVSTAVWGVERLCGCESLRLGQPVCLTSIVRIRHRHFLLRHKVVDASSATTSIAGGTYSSSWRFRWRSRGRASSSPSDCHCSKLLLSAIVEQ